jgi:hypothetical protein
MSRYCLYRTIKYEGKEGKGAYEIVSVRRGSALSRSLLHLYHERLDFTVYRIARRLKKLKAAVKF